MNNNKLTITEQETLLNLVRAMEKYLNRSNLEAISSSSIFHTEMRNIVEETLEVIFEEEDKGVSLSV